MPFEQILLIAAVVVALVALSVAVVAIVKLHAVNAQLVERPETLVERPETLAERPETLAERPETAPSPPSRVRPSATIVRRSDAPALQGRVVMTPSSAQVFDATMSRPLVRATLIAHGLAHALRPESVDRIRALMRRDLNNRRRARKRIARRAARNTLASPQRTVGNYGRHAEVDQAWLGELPASVTDRRSA